MNRKQKKCGVGKQQVLRLNSFSLGNLSEELFVFLVAVN